MDGTWHKPVGVRGWTHVVFKREKDGKRRVRSLDDLLVHLDAWDRSADRRVADRRVTRAGSPATERRAEERREEIEDTQERRRQIDQAGEHVGETGPSKHIDALPALSAMPTEAGLEGAPQPATSHIQNARAQSPLVIVSRI